MYFALMSLDNGSNNIMTSTVLCVSETEKCFVIRSFVENNRDEIEYNLLCYSRNDTLRILTYCVYTFCFDFFPNVQGFFYFFSLMFSCSGIFLKQILKACISKRTNKAAF